MIVPVRFPPTLVPVLLVSGLFLCAGGVTQARGQIASPAVEDARLTMRVKTVLLNDGEIGAQAVDVRVEAGLVVLSGYVATDEQAVRAIDLARTVDGVREVRSSLAVGSRPAPPADAERGGRLPSIARRSESRGGLLALGVSATVAHPTGSGLAGAARVGPVLRLRPGERGWGPAVGFSWTEGELGPGPTGQPALASLSIRPVMAGLEARIVRGRVAASLSGVAGYAFNSLTPDATRSGPDRALAVDNSVAGRAGVSVWIDVSRRLGLNLFGGYLVTRPTVTFASDTDLRTTTVNADAVIVSVGVAYWLF